MKAYLPTRAFLTQCGGSQCEDGLGATRYLRHDASALAKALSRRLWYLPSPGFTRSHGNDPWKTMVCAQVYEYLGFESFCFVLARDEEMRVFLVGNTTLVGKILVTILKFFSSWKYNFYDFWLIFVYIFKVLKNLYK